MDFDQNRGMAFFHFVFATRNRSEIWKICVSSLEMSSCWVIWSWEHWRSRRWVGVVLRCSRIFFNSVINIGILPFLPDNINLGIHVQLLYDMVLRAFKVQKLSGSSPEVLQNCFDSIINIGLLPPLSHHINSGMHVQHLGNMVLGAFKVQESTGTSLEALQNFFDSLINIGLLPSLPHHINSGMDVQHLGNMVLGAFKVHESTGTSLEAL